MSLPPNRINVIDEQNGSYIYTGYHMEAFIPDEYFQKKLAEQIADNYYIFGNFITYHYFNEKMDSREQAVVASFEQPSMFFTCPDEVTVEKVDIGYGLQKYHILHYYKGSVVIKQTEMVRNVNNVEKMTTLAFEGKLDNVDYDRIPSLYNICKVQNGAKLLVPAMYEEVIFATTYRNPDNLREAARFFAKSKNSRVTGMTLREKAAFTTTYAAASFEDKISMFTVSHNAKMENREEVISPIEKFSLGIVE